MARKHKRSYRMHGLAGFKEDALEVLSVGGGAVVGVAVAKFVTGKLEDMKFAQDAAKVDAAGKAEKNAIGKWVVPFVPAAVGIGILYGAAKFSLKGAARSAALGTAAGMAAVTIGKLVVAASPDLGKKLYLNGLGANVDTYDSGLLAGLGEFDASVARYMMAGSPTQVQSLMGAPLQVQAFAGAPTQVQTLAAAPMSATLM